MLRGVGSKATSDRELPLYVTLAANFLQKKRAGCVRSKGRQSDAGMIMIMSSKSDEAIRCKIVTQ